MSRVCEKLNLQSGGGDRVVGVEEKPPHHQMPNAGGHPLCALGALDSRAKLRILSMATRGGRSVKGRSWGFPRLTTRVPLGAIQSARCSSCLVKVPCRWVRSRLSERRRVQSRLLKSAGSAS